MQHKFDEKVNIHSLFPTEESKKEFEKCLKSLAKGSGYLILSPEPEPQREFVAFDDHLSL
jgi:hypothetical protein